MNHLHQPRNEHQRRQLLNAALPANSPVREFVAPDSDPDLRVTFPFGKYQGLTLGQVLEQDPGYLAWMGETCDLREGRFTEAFAAVCCRYQQRIEQAAQQRRFRRAERM